MRANIAAQLVNPEPNLTLAPPESDGERIANAIKRYRTNRTYPLQTPSGVALSGTTTQQNGDQMAPPAAPY